MKKLKDLYNIKYVQIYNEDTLFANYTNAVVLIPERSFFFGLIKIKRILRFYLFPNNNFLKKDYKGEEIDEILNGKIIESPFKDVGYVKYNKNTGNYDFIVKPHINIIYLDGDCDSIFDTPENLSKIKEDLLGKEVSILIK